MVKFFLSSNSNEQCTAGIFLFQKRISSKCFNFCTIYWKGQLSRASTQNSGILTISEATSGDSGLYDCVARDVDGQEMFESARVTIDAFEALPTASITPERLLGIFVYWKLATLIDVFQNALI